MRASSTHFRSVLNADSSSRKISRAVRALSKFLRVLVNRRRVRAASECFEEKGKMLRVVPRLSLSPSAAVDDDPQVDETPEQRVRRIFKNADVVCFDVDSTVCQDEAIDELASFLGVGELVSEATKRAMNGRTSFRQALAGRLDIMRPTFVQLEEFSTRPPLLTPGVKELVSQLHSRGTHVYLVSGGFRRLIEPVADILGIDRSRVYANRILFNDDGSYAGFDENELTSESGSKDVGKAGVCGLLKRVHRYQNMVMVGDGATDLEACPPADAFIGFGGNAVRESVRSQADWFVNSFDELLAEI